MEQQTPQLDTSAAATESQHQWTQAQHDAWVEQFLAHTRKVFGLSAQSKSAISEFAQELEQLGYFGFAHYVRTHAMCKPECRLLCENQPSR